MKLKQFIGIIFLIYITSLAQTDQVNITFKVTSDSISPTEQIYITGNSELLGNWSPNQIPLDKKENFWMKTITFNKNELIEFKFTKGSWESEALDEKRNKPFNYKIKVKNDSIITYHIPFWKKVGEKAYVKGQITGNVIYHREMEYPGLLKRDVLVWLPPGYNNTKDNRFPVLYMNDGQTLFDPNTSFTKIDWQLDETADSLIRIGKIEPMLIVGIYNTFDRSEEYSSTPKGIKYMEFIVNKLKPFIDSSYRTLPDRLNTSVGGSSMGGLISFMLAWNYSDYFSKAACFSPAFKYKDFDYTKIVKKSSEDKKDILLYIDNGGVGLEAVLQPGVDLMIEALSEKGYKLNKDLFVRIEKDAEHNEAAWAKRVHIPLELFYSKN